MNTENSNLSSMVDFALANTKLLANERLSYEELKVLFYYYKNVWESIVVYSLPEYALVMQDAFDKKTKVNELLLQREVDINFYREKVGREKIER